MGVRHGVLADQVGTRTGMALLELAGFISFKIVNFITAAIDQDRTRRSHNRRTSIPPVDLHALTTFPFPRKHGIVILETRHQRVVKLPVVFELISSPRG